MPYDTLTETEWEQVQRVWHLLEAGEIERAGDEVRALCRTRAGHPDVRIVEAALALDEDEPLRALEALAGAERSADPALFFHLRASALYQATRFAEARADADRALAIQPDAPEIHDLLSRIADHLGDAHAARDHAEQAAALDPDAFALPLEVDDETFDAHVQRSLDDLPARVRRELDEIPILVESLPDAELLAAESPPLTPDLLGLFVGRHLQERSFSDAPDAPGAIYLFRRNLLRMCDDTETLEGEIRTTVLHEVGHLLGLDEDDLEEWGLA
jgi:predicted Zn-dependent protease with MMP-like domain